MNNKDRIEQIKARCQKATLGPWHVNFLDDSHFMNLVAVTTRPDSGKHEALLGEETKEIRESIVATTLLQAEIPKGKPFVDVRLEDEDDIDPEGYPNYCGWDDDATFIAHAREDIPWLLQRIEDLENELLKLNKEG